MVPAAVEGTGAVAGTDENGGVQLAGKWLKGHAEIEVLKGSSKKKTTSPGKFFLVMRYETELFNYFFSKTKKDFSIHAPYECGQCC